CLPLYRNRFVPGAGAGSHSSGDLGRLRGTRCRTSDAAARCDFSQADGGVASVATLRPLPEFAASAADVTAIARQIDAADNIVIMCGSGCHGAADELRALSDRLKAPLIHSVKGKDIMPYDDPRWMGGIGMIGTKAVYHAVMQCDLFLMLGTDYPYAEFLPRKSTVIQIDDRVRVLGRRTPTELGVVGS